MTNGGELSVVDWQRMDDNRELNRIRALLKGMGRPTREQVEELRLIEGDLEEFERDMAAVGREQLDEEERREYQVKRAMLEYAMARGYRKRRGATQGPQISIGDTWQTMQEQRGGVMSKLKKDMQVAEKEYTYVFEGQESNVEFEHEDGDEVAGNNENEVDEALAEALEKEAARVKTIEETRKTLPVYGYRDSLLSAIAANPVVVVVGETGSGKTTQIPQYLCEAGYCEGGKKVGCTQPRRVAATSVAARVADEVGCKVGAEVGYSVRFDNKSGTRTKIKFLTDGMLLREFVSDVSLEGYSAIMVDEAHERTLSTDLLLGLLREIVQDRPDFRVIVASATINAERFSKYFGGAPIFNVPGRRFPVEVYYTKREEHSYANAAVTTVMQVHMTQKKGDILVFLTGQEEIEGVAGALEEIERDMASTQDDTRLSLLVCPIYANLPPDQQARIFEPTPKGSRKVVLATNIAETSLTIEGIAYVVDSGYVKENVFRPATGVDCLEVKTCSQASANQRAGRAGRVGPGKCFRLYTRERYLEMAPSPSPEILRVDLSGVVLSMAALGITNLVTFPFMDAPSTQSMKKALEELYGLGALNERGQLTSRGRRMAELPTGPRMARALVGGLDAGIAESLATVAALVDELSTLWVPSSEGARARERFRSPWGDYGTLLNVWAAWAEADFATAWCYNNGLQAKTLRRAEKVRGQLMGVLRKQGASASTAQVSHITTGPENPTTVLTMRTVALGLAANLATLSGDCYRTVGGEPVWVHPTSALAGVSPPPARVLYRGLVRTRRSYMVGVLPVVPSWLPAGAARC